MSGRKSAYSPLPQSNSDSDGSSEEELHIPQNDWVLNRFSKNLNSRTEKLHNSKKENKINYKLLDTDGDVVVTLIKFQSNSEEVSVLKPNNNLHIFSTTRKICFALSLLLCIFSTVAFIWVLPCNVGSCLSPSNAKHNLYNWNQTLPGLELYGPISIVSDTSSETKNVIFLLRSLLSHEGLNKSEGGMVSLNGNNGTVLWQFRFQKAATDTDCSLIDVDLDGYNDCVFFGNSFMKIVHSFSGKELWDIQESNKRKLKLLDFPLVVPDLDGDNVNDFVTSCSFINFSSSSHNYLVIISGKSGAIINNPLEINLCFAVHNLMFENSSFLTFTCYNSGEKESIQTINLIKVYNTLKSIQKKQWTSFKLHQHWRGEKDVRVDGRRLILENQGQCPQDCIILVDVKDEREGYNNKTVYSYVYRNAFGMIPVVAKSENVEGFLLKIWKWHPRKGKLGSQNNSKFPNKRIFSLKSSIKENLNNKENKLQSSLTLDKEMLMESNLESKRLKRNSGSLSERRRNGSVINSNGFNLHVITQIIMVITFNNTIPIVKNLSEEEIIQICPTGGFCEPDVNQQRHSMLVTDLNEDERQELISFTSKYVHEMTKTEEDNGSWKIQSNVKVMSL